jgi:hypothetical protein
MVAVVVVAWAGAGSIEVGSQVVIAYFVQHKATQQQCTLELSLLPVGGFSHDF